MILWVHAQSIGGGSWRQLRSIPSRPKRASIETMQLSLLLNAACPASHAGTYRRERVLTICGRLVVAMMTYHVSGDQDTHVVLGHSPERIYNAQPWVDGSVVVICLGW